MSYEDDAPANPPEEQPEQPPTEPPEEEEPAPAAAANPTPNEILRGSITPTPPQPAAADTKLTPNQIIASLVQK
jgi:hypothetical protein